MMKALLPSISLLSTASAYHPSLGKPEFGPCVDGPCSPGHEKCGAPFTNAPAYHLMDQNGCGENDPNGPVFDPVHGVIHHFFQDHLATKLGDGPVYGHFVSKDFVSWAQLPVAIWNGWDYSVTPARATPYDNVAIYTGSAVIVDGAGPGGVGPGVVNIYPGLCHKDTWDNCTTGTLLAQAVPADYAGDQLLENWTKPSYNPIMNNTERDPSTPWKEASGEWRLRNYNSMYGADSDADMLAGKWYALGDNPDFRTCECPSFYPLPKATPGFEAEYAAANKSGGLPTHVHKTSCDGDWWQLGTYVAGPRKTTGSFKATKGWEDLYNQKRIDAGAFYASKDNFYPTKSGASRRINWGWAQVSPQSTQTLPREITFNALARVLEQRPIEEVEALRGPAAHAINSLALSGGSSVQLIVGSGIAKQSEVVVSFALPTAAASFGLQFGKPDSFLTGGFIGCIIEYQPPQDASAPFHEVPVVCGNVVDTLRITNKDTEIELRVFVDNTFIEAYFQQGRVAMTANAPDFINDATQIELVSTAAITVNSATVYPMRSIWTSPDTIRNTPRVYPNPKEEKVAAPKAKAAVFLEV